MYKIAIVDPGSYSLPYDYYYINELAKYYKIEFYCSTTVYNYEYLKELKKNYNVRIIEYKISGSVANRFKGSINYIRMLLNLTIKKNKYIKIHFMWSLFPPIEFLIFFILKNKLIFTFHNDTPHNYRKSFYFPYKIISMLAKKIIFLSEYTKNEFIKNYKYNGVFHLLIHGVLPILNLKINNKTVSFKINKNIIFFGRIEEYKGIDIFSNNLREFNIEIYGKWNSNLKHIKAQFNLYKNIKIVDKYLTIDELKEVLTKECIFILPYKKATQSGVLYTLLAYERVFIASNTGENANFLIRHGLEKLIFDIDNNESIYNAVNYAQLNYWEIKDKLREIKKSYEWNKIMRYNILKIIYEK